MLNCETEIYQYKWRIEYASNEIYEASQEIITLIARVEQLSADIENKQIQLDILNEQEADLRQQRDDDDEAFRVYEIKT